MSSARELFVNLPVKDLDRARQFYTSLGFDINSQFTDDKAACVVLGDNISAMLLTEPFFKTFTDKRLADSKRDTEVLLAIDVGSREAVDELVNRAVEAGGTALQEPRDHGWMYQHGFTDLDGHQWEVMYADERQLSEDGPGGESS